MNELKIYKMYEDVNSPVFASEGSACFDMHAYLKTGQDILIQHLELLKNQLN